MTALMDSLASYGLVTWFILAVALIVLDFIIPGVHFVWFGLAAALTGAIAWLASQGGVEMTWPLQVLIYAVLSVASVFLVKQMGFNVPGKSPDPYMNVRGAEFIGRTVIVDEAIINGRGRVVAGDSVWPAQGEDAAKGATVMVTGVNGSALVVEGASDGTD